MNVAAECIADAHLVASQSDIQEKTVNNLAAQIKKLRLVLYKKFTFSIDSLTPALQKGEAREKREIETMLRELTQKRAQVSPALPLFSFDPLLIARINSSNTKDNLEKSIYMDYLSNALSEVDSNIAVIQNKENEVAVLIRLNEHAEDFMDELESTQFLGSMELENSSNEPAQLGGKSYVDREAFANDIITIYEHLDPVMSELIETPHIANFDSLASDEYLKLLQGTEKTLKLYKKIIEEKMTEK